MQSDDKSRVLAAADIVKVIGDHVALKGKGRERVGLCPFHEDRNPSMYVVPHKQMFHCFVCGAGGNAITFVMDYHKMNFREALTYLAERFGVKLTPWKPPSRSAIGSAPAVGDEASYAEIEGPQVSREQLALANATAQAYFRALLKHAEHGKQAREILARRGVSAEMIERFGLGVAADRWDGLQLFLQSKKLDPAPYAGAGLLKLRDSGGHYDAFRNRITFPIQDVLGRTIAFGARRINDADEPKYLNSSESALFNKSATLYGIHLAAEAIRKANRAVVCEGYMDAIACHQAGLCNVVATLGTALTAQSSRVLQRFCSEVVLLFDGDEAGQRAADRAIEVLFTSSMDVRIATLSGVRTSGGLTAKDPDELLKLPGGPEALQGAFDRATEAVEYRYKRLKGEWAGLNLSERAEAVERELQRLVEMGLHQVSPVRKQLIIRRIGEISGVDEATIRRVIVSNTARAMSAATLRTENAAPTATAGGSPADRGPALKTVFEHLLACILSDDEALRQEPELAPELAELLRPTRFERPAFAALAEAVLPSLADGSFSGDAALTHLESSDVIRTASAAVGEISRLCDANPMRVRRHFYECLASARRQAAQQSTQTAIPPSSDALAEWAARLRKSQADNASMGRDARSLPKPSR